MLYGFKTFNTSTGNFTLSQIANGSVSIPVWVTSTASENLVKYSGNGSGGCVVAIVNTGSGSINDDPYQPIAQKLFSSVSFTNGGATRAWSAGENCGGGNPPGGGGEPSNPSDFTYTETETAVTITGYTGSATSVNIPASINGKPVTTIGKEAFYSSDVAGDLTSIIIPNIRETTRFT